MIADELIKKSDSARIKASTDVGKYSSSCIRKNPYILILGKRNIQIALNGKINAYILFGL